MRKTFARWTIQSRQLNTFDVRNTIIIIWWLAIEVRFNTGMVYETIYIYIKYLISCWMNAGSIGGEFWNVSEFCDPFGFGRQSNNLLTTDGKQNTILGSKSKSSSGFNRFIYWPISLIFYSQISRRCTLLDRQVDITYYYIFILLYFDNKSSLKVNRLSLRTNLSKILS